MPIASQANSHAIGSIGVRILCSDVTILFVIRMRSPIPAFRHPPNLRSPESSLTLVVHITGYMALKFLTFRNLFLLSITDTPILT